MLNTNVRVCVKTPSLCAINVSYEKRFITLRLL